MTMQIPSADKHWRSYLVLLFVSLAGLIWIYHGTAATLYTLWSSSETYAHGFVIFPISLYLIWSKRATLNKITPRPSIRATLALALLCLGWLVAQTANVQVIAQYMFVAMIPALVTALLGWRVARAIAFPLAFTLLAVPFGDVFIRPLIDFTAHFSVSALQLTGIPVYRDGSHITLPSGSWMVVDACSGLRYLIASFTLGCLYAYLTYHSLLRRLLFIVMSLIVPIIANGIRAYLIILLGHLSSMKLATGVDHLIYGWLFFGLVMFLLFWAGNRWRENDVRPTPNEAAGIIPLAGATPLKAAVFAATALAIAWAAPVYLQHLEQQAYNPAPVSLSLPENFDGWTATPATIGLQPIFPGATATLMQEYRQGNQVIGIYLAYFRNENANAKAVTSQNLLAAEKSPTWSLFHESIRELHVEPKHVRQSSLVWGNRKLMAWQWYWIAGTQTANPYLAKMLQAKQHLFGQGDDSTDVVIFAPYDAKPDDLAIVMEDFITHASPAIRNTLTSAR